MLQQKDMSLQEKNDQLNLMQKRMEQLQDTSGSAQMADDPRLIGPDAIYKSIDRGDQPVANKPLNFEVKGKSEMNQQ